MTVAEIKDKAKESVQKEARGASAITLLRTARTQSAKARTSEESGDLKGALDAITKAASLTRMCMDSSEFKTEKHGVLHKEFRDFMAVCIIFHSLSVRGQFTLSGARWQ